MLSFDHIISKAKAVIKRCDETGNVNRGELKNIHNQIYFFTPKLPGIEYIENLKSGCQDCVIRAVDNLRDMVNYYDTAKVEAQSVKELAEIAQATNKTTQKPDKTETKPKNIEKDGLSN